VHRRDLDYYAQSFKIKVCRVRDERLELQHSVESLVPKINRRVAIESLRDYDGENRLHDPDGGQLFPNMFPAYPMHSLHYPSGHRSRHQDQNDRSGQFHPNGRGEAVHPHHPQ